MVAVAEQSEVCSRRRDQHTLSKGGPHVRARRQDPKQEREPARAFLGKDGSRIFILEPPARGGQGERGGAFIR